METLQIKRDAALKAYNGATGEVKKALSTLFGADLNVNIIDRVKTFQDALNVSGYSESAVLPYSNAMTDRQEALNAMAKIWHIIMIINEGWIADFSNSNQIKYYPWFTQSGSGLSYDDDDRTHSGAYVGSRLCLSSSEKAEYVGKQFIDIYSKFLIQ